MSFFKRYNGLFRSAHGNIDSNGNEIFTFSAPGKVSSADSELNIARGNVSGLSSENKWGIAPDFDTTDGEVDIWDAAEDGQSWEQMTYTFSDTDDIDSISSTDAADTMDITIEGIRAGVAVTQTVTLDGQNKVNFTALGAINRMYNANGTAFVGHVVAYVDTAISSGVPTDTTKIRSLMHPEEQQTEQTIYTIASNQTAYLKNWYSSIAGANKTSNYKLKLKIQEPSGVFRTKNKISVSDSGSSFAEVNFGTYLEIPGGSRIKITAEATAAGVTQASISAGFDLILVDD